jgi:type I restriction enzyme S subunit
MIEGLKPYPAMKDSGVPWLGEVPEHWELRRMKTLLRERIEKGHPDEPLLAATQSKGVVRKEQYENRTVLALKDLHLLKLVRVGDFVISLRSFQGGIEYAREQGIISPAYTILFPASSGMHGYLAQLFKSAPYIENLSLFVTGIRQGQNIDYEKLARAELPIPSRSEQAAIVRFLGHADHKIRRYIRAKQKLIKLLEEQKQAIIHRAVTRGLDPDVRLKPSGVEWLGDVPEHWEVKRVKQAAKILRGKFTHRPRNDPALYDGAFPFIQTGEVARAEKEITQYRQTLNARGLAVSKMFPSGTLVMTIAANIGDVALLEFEACFPDSIVGFIPRTGVERDFLYYLFCAMKVELLREAPVNTQGNLNVDRIGSRAIALPPADEQTSIVLSIEADTARLSKSIKHMRREIELLHEYRTRLIADVVTGKLDVREAAACLSEEAMTYFSEDPEAEEDPMESSLEDEELLEDA